MAYDEQRSAKADYIENGYFEGGKLEPWKVLSGDVSVQHENGGYCAILKHGSRLNQHFILESPQPRQFTVRLDIRVENGSEEATGQVQLIWFSGLVSRTFNLVEYPEWTTITIPVYLSSPTFSHNLEVLVQSRFDNPVSVTNISLTDQTGTPVKLEGAVEGGEKKVPEDSDSVRQ